MAQRNVFERDYKPFPELGERKTKRFSMIHYAAIAAIATGISVALSAISLDAEAHKQSDNVVDLEIPSPAERLTMPLSLPHSNTAEIAEETEITGQSQTTQNTPDIQTAKLSEETVTKPQQIAAEPNQYDYKTIEVKKGDTLTHVFKRAGLKLSQVNYITQAGKEGKKLTRLTPGEKFEIASSDEGELLHLVYHKDKTNKYVLNKHADGFTIDHEAREYDRRVTHTTGTIKTSLFEAAVEAGLSDNVTMDLAHIFGWDIDFALDIRKGDQFVVMYEELYLDGERVGNGNILAAEFTNRGKSYKAVRYTDDNGNSNYYAEDGKSMRKAFLRTPVDFTRISSRFGNRYHPTLKRKKKHHGVDYAAPRGTPIKAAGDGKIVWRARKGGYGKTVIIKHGTKYSTLYAHMNSYNRKARKGSYVKQGQVIGYVGTTGRSTGPHLHYEFRVNGVHRNPLTVKLPDAESIKKKYKSDFLQKSRPLLAQLDLIKNTSVALNSVE